MKLAGVITAFLVAAVAFVGTPAGPVPVAVAAPTSIDCSVAAAGASTPAPPLESFAAQTPERIADTRVTEGGSGPVPAGCALVLDMAGIGPADVTAYALSVTAIANGPGFVTAYACADGLPGTSNLNPRAGIATPNLVVVSPDAAGDVCLFSFAGGELIVDVSGWWSSGPNRFQPIEPVRVEDTRESLPIKLPAGDVRAIDVAGVAVPADAVAVTVNLAATQPNGSGFLVAFPCGFPVPNASNVNFLAGETRSVAAIVKLGDSGPAEGKLCVSASQDLHVVIDVTGYDSDTSGSRPDLTLEPITDTRLVDTRDPAIPGSRFAARTVQRFDLSSVLSRPQDAVGVLLNVVAVAGDADAFVTVYPCTAEVPFVSSINHDRLDTANLVVTALDDSADFCVYAETGVDVVVDLVGVYGARDGALLHQLVFRDGDGDTIPLDQQFEVGDVDYTIPCDGPQSLGLRIGRTPGVTVSVNGVTVFERPEDRPDVPVTVFPEGLTDVIARRGATTQRFAIRCLPNDFPRFQVDETTAAPPGWYLTEIGWNDGAAGHFVAVLDGRGVPVWYKRADDVLIDLKPLANGDFVVSPITGTGMGIDPDRGHVVVDLAGSVIDERLSGDPNAPVDHHDYVEILSAGSDRRAIVSYPQLGGVDLSALTFPTEPSAQFFACDASVAAAGATIVDGSIIEAGGGLGTWRWNMSDHFDAAQSTYAQCFGNFPALNGGAGEVDPFHINSIDRVTDAGCEPSCDYVVSARHLDAIFRVDRSSEAVEWVLGPDSGSGAPNLTVLNDPLGGPLRPHDARLDGDVLTFHDNRTGTTDPSRAVAYEIDVTAQTATLLWQVDHPEGENNPSLGSARVTDDGTILVGWGRARPLFSEHAANGTELTRWTPVDSPMTAYRIVKYPLGTFDAEALRATAGGSIDVP